MLLYCFYEKRITLCSCLCSCSPFSRFSASLIQNIGGAKKYFIDHGTSNTIRLFVPIKRKFLQVYSFSEQVAANRNSTGAT